jgi:hypothetical protein
MNGMAIWKHVCAVSLALPLAFAAEGCAVQTADGTSAPADEKVATSSEAFNGGWGYTWNVSSQSSLDMGADANKSCFLAGVTGNLVSELGFETVTQGSYVQINRRNGHYYLDIDPSVGGEPEGGTVFCVPTVANRTTPVTHFNWNSQTAPTFLGAATPGRQCFLTGVENISEQSEAHQDFSEAGDSLQVFKSGNSWYLGGTGVAAGQAACVDVSGVAGGWEWIAPTYGTATHDLAGAGGGVTCMLTGIGGSFKANSWSDGVVISEEQSLLKFQMTVSNGKTGWTTCVY